MRMTETSGTDSTAPKVPCLAIDVLVWTIIEDTEREAWLGKGQPVVSDRRKKTFALDR